MKKIHRLFILTFLFCILVPLTAYSQESNEALILVNKKNMLDNRYMPSNLINISNSVQTTKSEILLNQEAYENYNMMIQQMAFDGITDIYVVSGYRSYSYQSGLYQNKISQYSHLSESEAIRRAGQIVAPPGASEHQTGLAIDVSSACVNFQLDNSFTKTEAFFWLKENSYKFGFILRYEENKKEITDIIYEPWHYRYVGVSHSTAIYEKNICLEEYIESLKE